MAPHIWRSCTEPETSKDCQITALATAVSILTLPMGGKHRTACQVAVASPVSIHLRSESESCYDENPSLTHINGWASVLSSESSDRCSSSSALGEEWSRTSTASTTEKGEQPTQALALWVSKWLCLPLQLLWRQEGTNWACSPDVGATPVWAARQNSHRGEGH